MMNDYLSAAGRASLTDDQRREYDERLPRAGSLYERREMLRGILHPTPFQRVRRWMIRLLLTTKPS